MTKSTVKINEAALIDPKNTTAKFCICQNLYDVYDKGCKATCPLARVDVKRECLLDELRRYIDKALEHCQEGE